MENSVQLRVGVVGCGYQGGNLIDAAKQVAGIDIRGCADPDQAAAEAAAQLAGGAAVFPTVSEAHAGGKTMRDGRKRDLPD